MTRIKCEFCNAYATIEEGELLPAKVICAGCEEKNSGIKRSPAPLENEAVKFLIPHGMRTVERMLPELMEALQIMLSGQKVNFNGKLCETRVHLPSKYGESWGILFDVIHPDDKFEHIEFMLTNTGWSKNI